MKQIIAATALTLSLATPLAAQTADNAEVDEGFSLLEQGAKLLLRGLMTEMEPAIEELKGMGDEMSDAMAEFTSTMGPALGELLAQIDDMRNYDAPEIMPNGNIIIRRKPDAPDYVPQVDAAPQTGEIEL